MCIRCAARPKCSSSVTARKSFDLWTSTRLRVDRRVSRPYPSANGRIVTDHASTPGANSRSCVATSKMDAKFRRIG